MTSNAYFENEQKLIEAELASLGPPQRTALVGGDKKVGEWFQGMPLPSKGSNRDSN